MATSATTTGNMKTGLYESDPYSDRLDDRMDRMDDTNRNLRQAAEQAGSHVREFFRDSSRQADSLRHTAEEKIIQHPMKAMIIAALSGVVVGTLLRR